MSKPNPSYVVQKERCPECSKVGRDRSADNLAVYSDGHKYCFACGYLENKFRSITDMRARIIGSSEIRSKRIEAVNSLSDSLTFMIPTEALRWITKYGITPQEIQKYGLFYDLERDLFCFPIYREGVLTVVNCRTFNNQVLHPGRYGMEITGKHDRQAKYLTYGPKSEIIRVLGQTDRKPEIVVLVEDFVSAIKVARKFRAIPLFGTTVPDIIIDWAKRSPNRILVLWLDFDKAYHARITMNNVREKYDNIYQVVSELDPKEYSTEEIHDFVLRNTVRFANPLYVSQVLETDSSTIYQGEFSELIETVPYDQASPR